MNVLAYPQTMFRKFYFTARNRIAGSLSNYTPVDVIRSADTRPCDPALFDPAHLSRIKSFGFKETL